MPDRIVVGSDPDVDFRVEGGGDVHFSNLSEGMGMAIYPSSLKGHGDPSTS